MERAKEPHLIEQAEQLLTEFRDKLDLESISLFKEDGSLLYSTDSFLVQQDDTESIFEILDVIVYEYIIGVPFCVTVEGNNKCLFVTPIYYYDKGVVDGWIFVLGSGNKMGYENWQAQWVKEDISDLDFDKNMRILGGISNLPRVLGVQREFGEELNITLEGEDGCVVFSAGELPTKVVKISIEDYPEFWNEIDELEYQISVTDLGDFVPKSKRTLKST